MVDTSPETNEQLLGQSPRGSHQATKCWSPPNCVTSIGRGRPQWSLSTTFVTRPGASSMVEMRKTMARPEISMRVRGRSSFATSAITAGATSTNPALRAMSWILSSVGEMRQANMFPPASRTG